MHVRVGDVMRVLSNAIEKEVKVTARDPNNKRNVREIKKYRTDRQDNIYFDVDMFHLVPTYLLRLQARKGSSEWHPNSTCDWCAEFETSGIEKSTNTKNQNWVL
jgi:hypothetical protein